MSRKEWSLLALVLGAVVIVQVVGHGGADEHNDAGHTHESAQHGESAAATSAEGAEQGTFRTVSLEVRGMT